MSIIETTRPTTTPASTIDLPSAGPESLNGHAGNDTHRSVAVEGQASPQAIDVPVSIPVPLAGSKASRSQRPSDIHPSVAAADNFPGGQGVCGTHSLTAAGDQVPPVARPGAETIHNPLLADPLLALAADVLGDLEKVRIANENRLRQLTRSAEDSDGETRGFGLDEAHPDVARLAALVGMLADAEHKATLNLQRVMRKHPLGPWMAAQKGIGEKQGARLLASIGDPYIRPEITREDATVEPSRPRMVSELWAYCGYHVIPVDQVLNDTQRETVGGELNGSGPGHRHRDTQTRSAGVAPKRQRGAHANWSAAAKMRAYLVAESCMKKSGTPYRAVYDATRAKYAEAVHAAECIRCGPKNKPAPIGSPLSDGHKHARALRAVAKEVLKELWREARRIHEEASASIYQPADIHRTVAAGGDMIPPPITDSKPTFTSAAG